MVMHLRNRLKDENMLYCLCPNCKNIRKKISGKLNIVKRGYERNGIARFLCLNCSTWFNEKTGDTMKWLER